VWVYFVVIFCIFLLTDARLCLFGSSCNGFGFRNSDLDITLTFKGRETDEVNNWLCFYLLQLENTLLDDNQ